MGIFQKKNGAVTIFLIIILVPVIVVTSIFVDVSRVQLAQAVINSAGDLSLNTLLSQYDTDLNEFYGLMASCQNIEEFYDTVGEYYETALKSAELEDGEAGAVAERIEAILHGEQDTADLLKITWEEEKAVSFSAVENGDLANAAILKKEIVEFMKYRSPINGTVELVKKLTESKDAIEDSAKDSELIDKKQDYYDAENKVLEKALEVYKSLKAYENLGIDKNYVESIEKDLKELGEEYRKIDEKVIKDLYNTQGLTVFEVQTIHTSPVISQTYSDSRKAGIAEIETAMENYSEAVQTFVSARRSLDNAINVMPEYSSSVYDIQYWNCGAGILNENQIYAKYAIAANALCEKYAILKQAVDYAADDALEAEYSLTQREGVASSGEKSLQNHFELLKNQYIEFSNQHFQSNDKFFTIGKKLNEISSQNMGAIDATETNQKIYEIYTRLHGYQDKINEAISYLEKARENVVELKNLQTEYQNASNNWRTTANNTDTVLAKKDKEEIEDLSQEEEIMNNITSEKVEELVNRINNVNSLFYGVIDALDDYQYNGTPVMDIDSFGVFRQKSGIQEDRISYLKDELNGYVQERKTLITEPELSISVTSENNPAIKSVNTPTLYTWIMEHFKEYEAKKEEYEEGKNTYKDYKDLQDSKDDGVDTEGNSGNHNEISQSGELPSQVYQTRISAQDTKEDRQTESAVKKVAEFTNAFCNDFSGTLMQLGITARDDLYSVDYIMSMFSYDTYENEGKYNLCTNKDDISLLNYQTEYQKVAEQWKSDKVTDTYNKTLTNHMINAENNWSYQNEVEYILYGGSNLENKAAAYTRIYLLRYALNLPAEFLNYWNDATICSIASGISAATLGVIPEPLVKLAIILTLTILETGCDILYLKAGIPVLLVKGSGDLFIDISADNLAGKLEENITDAAKSAGKGNGDASKFDGLNVTFQYSDYLRLFLFMKLFSEEKSYWVYARTADVIQANMRYQIVKDDSYSLSKSIVYFKAESKLRVEPLMLDLQLVRSETDNRIEVLKELDWCKINYEAIRGY